MNRPKSSRAGDAQGLPVAEDHDREREEAEARHVAVCHAVRGGQRVHESAQARQGAGDHDAAVAHLVDIDAQGGGRLRILAASAEPEAEAGLVEEDGQHDEQDDDDIGRQIDLIEEGLSQKAQVLRLIEAEHGLLHHEPAGRVALVHPQFALLGDQPNEEADERRGQHVEGRAADGLIRLQVDGREGQQQGEYCAGRRRDQHNQHQEQLYLAPVGGHVLGDVEDLERVGLLHQVDGQRADEGAEDHDTFQREVDDAASFGKNACQRNDHQRNGIDQSFTDKE